MGAKVSPEMLRAISMIKAGLTRYQAAKRTGLTISGITRSKLYRELIQQQGSDNKK